MTSLFKHIRTISFTVYSSKKTSFDRIELEEITDDEENDKRPSTNNAQKTSTKEVIDTNEAETNRLLENIATNLVDSILNEALNFEKIDHDDDINTGVRELSDDENALRELDENDMSGTDEFILFAGNAETSDHDADDYHDNTNQASPTITRGSLNRLYTFSRTNDDTTIQATKNSPNQVCIILTN